MNMSLASTTISWSGGSMCCGRQELRDSAGMASKIPGIRVDMGDFNAFCCSGGLIWTPTRGDTHQSNVHRTRSAVLEVCLWTSEWVYEYVLGVHDNHIAQGHSSLWTPSASPTSNMLQSMSRYILPTMALFSSRNYKSCCSPEHIHC